MDLHTSQEAPISPQPSLHLHTLQCADNLVLSSPQNLILMANIWIVKAAIITSSVLRIEACRSPVFSFYLNQTDALPCIQIAHESPDLPHPMSGRRRPILAGISKGRPSVLASQPSFSVDRRRLPWSSVGCRSLWLGILSCCSLKLHLSFCNLVSCTATDHAGLGQEGEPLFPTSLVVASSSARCVQPCEIDT